MDKTKYKLNAFYMSCTGGIQVIINLNETWRSPGKAER
jgi:hypothetical protein